MGEYPKAVETLGHNLVPLDSPVVRERFGPIGLPFAFSRRSLAVALAERGEFIEAVTRCTEANQIAEAVGHPFSVTMTYRGMGHLHLRRGDLRQATIALEHALKICQEVDSRPLFHAVSSTLGYAYALSGRSAEAIPLLEQAVDAPSLTGPGGPIAAEHLVERSVSAGQAGSGCPCRCTARLGSRPSAQRERIRSVHSSAPWRDRGARKSP